MSERVVITGMGVICALGNTVNEVWDNLLLSKDIVTKTDCFDMSNYRSQRSTIISKKTVRSLKNPRLHDVARIGLHAVEEALNKSGLTEDQYKKSGLSIGTTSGGTMDKYSDAFHFGGDMFFHDPDNTPVHSAMTLIARKLKLHGPVYNMSMACISSSYAIMNAAELIRSGDVEIMIAGGCDRVRKADFAGFNALRSVSPDYCRPFDRDRKGLIMGDGGAFLVLESLKHAKNRKAKILAEIIGEGHTSDAYHATAPDSNGIARAMQQAIAYSGIKLNKIQYINCHGTGTALNDKAEIHAIKKVFGEYADNLYIGSTKSITGHLLGTAGAIEAIISILAVKHGIAPPSAHCINPDPEVNSKIVGNMPITMNIDYAMSNSLGFGGNNVSLVFSKKYS
jgi:3-oxoacyl-(acyl-carrier-protein) synthase